MPPFEKLRQNYLPQLHPFRVQVSGEQFFCPQAHFLEHVFSHLLPLVQQLLPLSPFPATAAAAMSMPAHAVKIIRFIS